MKKIIPVFLFFIFFASVSWAAELPKLLFFHSPTCHSCMEIKNEFMPAIEREFKDQVEIEYLDISNVDNYKLLLGLIEKSAEEGKVSVPAVYFNKRVFIGSDVIRNNLEGYINETLHYFARPEILPEIDLVKRFKNFTPFLIISAGLIDGINPCAFTVIVFFISFLALQGYKRRQLIVIGLVFIFAVFLTYLLLGVGLFNALYRLEGIWLATRIFNISVGILSIILGFLALFDFFKFKKTKETEGLLLQLPKAIKNRIHALIGIHYRDKEKTGNSRKNILILALSALVTGFLVSLLEAVCTGQTYIPTIAFVLKASALKLQAIFYLLLYNSMFIVPLLLIFFFALLGVTSEQFSRILKKHMLSIKLLMAGLFFVLGAFLLWRV